MNSNRIPDTEIKKVQDDFISGLIFLENYKNNEFEIKNFEKIISEIYNEKFKKYNISNELEIKILETEIINQNIIIDLIRQKTIEKMVSTIR